MANRRLFAIFIAKKMDLKRRRNEWTSSGRPERRPTKRRSARVKSFPCNQRKTSLGNRGLFLCFGKDRWDLKRRRNEWTSGGRPERRPTKRRSARVKSFPCNQQVAPKKISELKTQKPQWFLGFFMPIFKVEFKRYVLRLAFRIRG